MNYILKHNGSLVHNLLPWLDNGLWPIELLNLGKEICFWRPRIITKNTFHTLIVFNYPQDLARSNFFQFISQF